MSGGANTVVASTGAATAATEDDDTIKLEDVPQLTVRGEARLAKAADEVRLNVGVQTQGADAREALDANTRRMNAVIDAITEAGLSADDYETGRFRIRPEYARRPRNASNDWRPTIIGYTVTNSLLIKTQRLELIGDLIAACNDAGANDVGIAGFGLSNPEQYRDEAITAATTRAVSDAKVLAAAADLELVRILRISVNAPNSAVRDSAMAGMARMAAAESGPPIDGGDVTIDANVSIIYEVRSRDAGN